MKGKKLKKALAFVLTAVMAVSVSSVIAFADVEESDYVVKSWEGDGSYTPLNDNETVLKGSETWDDENKCYPGPYSYDKGANLADGIIKEVNVLVDPDAATEPNNVLFVLSSSINTVADGYYDEAMIQAEKTLEGNVLISGKASEGNGSYTVETRDVYTIRYEFANAEGGISVNVDLLGRDGNKVCDLVQKTVAFKDSTSAEDYEAGYMWFVAINATDGITLYNEVPQDTISLDEQNWNVEAGNVYKLTATVGPEFLENKEVTWTSSDEKVLTVEPQIGENGEFEGIVTAVAPGTATVTAEFNGVTAQCAFNVTEKETAGPGENDGNQTGTDAENADKNANNSPKTGDEMNLLIPAIVLMAAAAGAGTFIIRRKNVQ